MVKLPRMEQSVPYRVAEMPFSSGDGYEAPGRALQKLGGSIASAGQSIAAAFGGEDDKEDDFKTKMAMLEYSNKVDLDELDRRANYAGDGTGYTAERAQYYQGGSADLLGKLSPKGQRTASLFLEQKRGSFLEGAKRFEIDRRQQSLYATTETTLTSEAAKLSQKYVGQEAVDPAQLQIDFDTAIASHDAIINQYPGGEQRKQALRAHAAQQMKAVLDSLPGGRELPAKKALMERLQQAQPQASGPGPTSAVDGQMHRWGGGSKPTPWPLYVDKTPSPGERAAIYRKGGVVVNLDTNWAAEGKQTTPMVVIPDDATPAQRQAADAYAAGIAKVYEQQFGKSLAPKVVTRSQNGRGRAFTIHTEPFSVNDTRAVEYFTSDAGAKAHAAILAETFGKVPGVHFSLPHDPYRKGDNGAKGPKGSEVDIARAVLSVMGGGGAAPQLAEGPQVIARGANGPDKQTVSLKGLTDEQKAAKLDELGQQGYRDFSYRYDDNERLIAKKADKFAWGPTGRAPVAEGAGPANVNDPKQFGGPGWANGPIGKFQRGEYDRNDTALPRQQVADASGKVVSFPATRAVQGSVAGQLLESLNKEMPQVQARHIKAVSALVDRIEKGAAEGYMPPEAELADTTRKVEALGLPDMTRRLAGAVAGAQATSKLQTMPPDEIAKIAQGMRGELAAKGKTASFEQLAAVEFIERQHDTVRKALDKDQIGHAIKTGVIPAQAPLDPAPDKLTVDALMARKDAAEVAAVTFDRPVKYLSNDEKVVFSQAMNRGGTELLTTLKTAYEAFGKDTPKLLGELGKDAPEAATIGWMVASGVNQQTLNDAADGVKLMRTEGFKSAVPSGKDLRSEAHSHIGNAFVESPRSMQAAVDTARAIYEVRALQQGIDPKTFDAKIFQKALDEVVGQNVDPNDPNKVYGGFDRSGKGWFTTGVSAVVPANIRQDKFRAVIEAVRLSDILPVQAVPGGGPMGPVAPSSPTLILPGGAGGTVAEPSATPEPDAPSLGGIETGQTQPQPAAPSPPAAVASAKSTPVPGVMVRGAEADTFERNGVLLDKTGRPMNIAVIRNATLVTVGDGQYKLATKNPLGEDPGYVKTHGGRDYVLDLKALEPLLKERVPEAYRPE